MSKELLIKRDYQAQKMRVKQAELYREDIRDLVQLTVRKMVPQRVLEVLTALYSYLSFIYDICMCIYECVCVFFPLLFYVALLANSLDIYIYMVQSSGRLPPPPMVWSR